MSALRPKRVVHLELHTGDLPGACRFYAAACGWRSEEVASGGVPYTALALGGSIGGGAVECGVDRSLWLPYVGVSDIRAATRGAAELGAAVLLEPREGPLGWRSVVSAPGAAQVAFWQPKR
jgi:predicted enzyme related to lactoylglutathione lyase